MEESDDGLIQTRICQLMFSLDCHKNYGLKGSPVSLLTYTCGRCGLSETDKSAFDLHLDSCRSGKSRNDTIFNPNRNNLEKLRGPNGNKTASPAKPLGLRLSGCVLDSPKISGNSPSDKAVHVHMQVVFNNEKENKFHSCKYCEESCDSTWCKSKEPFFIKPHECKVCHEFFPLGADLATHMKIHKKNKQLKCETCNKCFASEITLEAHTKIHTTADTPKFFRCESCRLTFTKKHCFDEHLQKHDRLKLYRCEICEKTFPTKSRLICHNRMHTGEKPFVCNHCQTGFSRNCFLQAHILKKHSNPSNSPEGIEETRAETVQVVGTGTVINGSSGTKEKQDKKLKSQNKQKKKENSKTTKQKKKQNRNEKLKITLQKKKVKATKKRGRPRKNTKLKKTSVAKRKQKEKLKITIKLNKLPNRKK